MKWRSDPMCVRYTFHKPDEAMAAIAVALARKLAPLPDWAKPRFNVTLKYIGKIPHVDSCPQKRRVAQDSGSTFANAQLDCPGCAHFWSPGRKEKIYSVRCAGHLAEKFPRAIHEDWQPVICREGPLSSSQTGC